MVNEWRQAPESESRVTAETARLLKHWRQHEFQGIKPFFCQIEAADRYEAICTAPS
jgi:type III restriction enzyme